MEVTCLTSTFVKCPHADSNCGPCLRRAVLYPLSYGGQEFVFKATSAGKVPVQGTPALIGDLVHSEGLDETVFRPWC